MVTPDNHGMESDTYHSINHVADARIKEERRRMLHSHECFTLLVLIILHAEAMVTQIPFRLMALPRGILSYLTPCINL